MENNKATILVLAIVAALIVTASGAYAMGRGGDGVAGLNTGTNRSGMGPSMMGGGAGYAGGMMGGNGMMRSGSGIGSICAYMGECTDSCWNSASAP